MSERITKTATTVGTPERGAGMSERSEPSNRVAPAGVPEPSASEVQA